jgi:hypothetical protein
LAGIAASVIQSTGSGRLIALMKPRIAMNHSAGKMVQTSPARYSCA